MCTCICWKYVIRHGHAQLTRKDPKDYHHTQQSQLLSPVACVEPASIRFARLHSFASLLADPHRNAQPSPRLSHARPNSGLATSDLAQHHMPAPAIDSSNLGSRKVSPLLSPHNRSPFAYCIRNRIALRCECLPPSSVRTCPRPCSAIVSLAARRREDPAVFPHDRVLRVCAWDCARCWLRGSALIAGLAAAE